MYIRPLTVNLVTHNEHTVNMERFAGLNFCSFNAIEVFAEILSRCLAKRAYYLICGYTMKLYYIGKVL